MRRQVGGLVDRLNVLARDIGEGIELQPVTILLDHGNIGAQAALNLARANGIRVAILKDGSPSCAPTYIHDGTFRGQRDPGQGVTAALLAESGIRVFSEKQLAEAAALVAALEAGGDGTS